VLGFSQREIRLSILPDFIKQDTYLGLDMKEQHLSGSALSKKLFVAL
jgi:hypothetical protein